MPYSLARHPFPPAVRQVRLGARTVLSVAGDDAYVRLRLVEARPGELAGFVAPGGGDHVRVEAVEGEPRTETVVDHSVDDGWIDLDVLVHGEPGAELGVIGAWAAQAPLGSPAVMAGPKGSVVLSGAPEEVVLAGDDSALPAVRRYLRMLGPSITGHLLLETRFDLASLGIEPPGGLRVSILSPDPHRPSVALAEALAALPAPTDPLERFVFACGEQSLVAPARAVLAHWGIDVERAVVKGYWKR
ncbi:siderophore-interacting protein [Microcella humidisoli]|uniref:Siderophore-interacting protein n=1 Tax=Microcella humidisoli TaxID=2963406 RepID=A0ABY5FTJ3_9MICO|nr:siderophore-interacting protein [Microcella humidisoli]UTT61614.1 siderophore-interacting protein [Microcella humidisoli]